MVDHWLHLQFVKKITFELVKRENGDGSLVQLRAYIAQGEFSPNDRLPPERILSEELGIARSELRKAFAVLESEGTIWRHVGRGTFVGSGNTNGSSSQTVGVIAKRTSPQEVMYARLVLEPQLAREAALSATADDVELLQEACEQARLAETWRHYETLDNQFHNLISEATQNTPLIALYEQLNALRRTIVWGRLRRRYEQPPENHHSFSEHEAILEAVQNRDTEAAESCMRNHLLSVRNALFPVS